MNPAAPLIAETLRDLHAWLHSAAPESAEQPPWRELQAALVADGGFDLVSFEDQVDMLRNLVAWHHGCGGFAAQVWRTAETHVLYQDLLQPAFACCADLEAAYLDGAANGGSIDWEDVDKARESSLAFVKQFGLKGYIMEGRGGETAFALTTDEVRAGELAAAADANAAPFQVTLARGYEDDDPAASPGRPRP